MRKQGIIIYIHKRKGMIILTVAASISHWWMQCSARIEELVFCLTRCCFGGEVEGGRRGDEREWPRTGRGQGAGSYHGAIIYA